MLKKVGAPGTDQSVLFCELVHDLDGPQGLDRRSCSPPYGDRWQRRNRVAGPAYGAIKKFSDDRDNLLVLSLG